MTTNDSKRLYEALLVGATVAITLVAALTAWAAQLGGTWLPVLVPFGLVLAVPVAALSWLRTDQSIESHSWRRAARPRTHSPSGP